MPDMQYVDSSNIEAIGYDAAKEDRLARPQRRQLFDEPAKVVRNCRANLGAVCGVRDS